MSSPAATRRRTLRYERVGVRASGGPKPNPNPASECGRAARDAPDETIAGRRVLWRADILEDTASDEALSTPLMWVNHKSRFEYAHVRLREWLGWPQASPREPLRCHISSLVIVETSKYSFEDLANKTDGTMVTSKP